MVRVYSDSLQQEFEMVLPTKHHLSKALAATRTNVSLPDINAWVRDNFFPGPSPNIMSDRDGNQISAPKSIWDTADVFPAFVPINGDGTPNYSFLSSLANGDSVPVCGAEHGYASTGVKRGGNGNYYNVGAHVIRLFSDYNDHFRLDAVKVGSMLVAYKPVALSFPFIDLWSMELIPRQNPIYGKHVLVDGEEMLITPPDFISDIDFAYDFLKDMSVMGLPSPYAKWFFCRSQQMRVSGALYSAARRVPDSPTSAIVEYNSLALDGDSPDTICILPQLTPVNSIPEIETLEGNTVPVCSIRVKNSKKPRWHRQLPTMVLSSFDDLVFDAPTGDSQYDVYGTWHNASLYLRQPLFYSAPASVLRDVERLMSEGRSKK